MSTCYRCQTVDERSGDGAGVCQECGALACPLDGERDDSNLDFLCGMCVPSRLTPSGGVPPWPRGGGGDRSGGGGGLGTPDGPAPTGSDGGAAAATSDRFASSADFEQRLPVLAEQSAAHRRAYRENITRILHDIAMRGRGEQAEALRTVDTLEWDPNRVAQTARLLAEQIDAARARGTLDELLLADAFGMAAWSVGVPPGEEPLVEQLRKIGDPRLRLVLATAPAVIPAGGAFA